MKIWTVGHSNLPVAAFLRELEGSGIQLVVDIRTVPKSRHNPQFEGEALSASLAEAGLAYGRLPELGGFRRPQQDSPNGAWRNESFRGYADYMQTPAFEAGLEQLLEWAAAKCTAIMCAEAVPWRCHRSLVADALTARGHEVLDILGAGPAKPHRMTPFAVVAGTRITYPHP